MIADNLQIIKLKKSIWVAVRKITFEEPSYLILIVAGLLSIVFLLNSRRARDQQDEQIGRYKTQIAWYQKQVDELYDLKVGDLIPEVEASDSQGNQFRVTYQEGQGCLFIIFSQGCHACVMQDKEVWKDLALQAKRKGYVVTGISLESYDASREFLQSQKFNFDVLFPNVESFNRAFRIRRSPQIIAVNRHGKVVFVHFGTIEKSKLKDLTDNLI